MTIWAFWRKQVSRILAIPLSAAAATTHLSWDWLARPPTASSSNQTSTLYACLYSYLFFIFAAAPVFAFFRQQPYRFQIPARRNNKIHARRQPRGLPKESLIMQSTYICGVCILYSILLPISWPAVVRPWILTLNLDVHVQCHWISIFCPVVCLAFFPLIAILSLILF